MGFLVSAGAISVDADDRLSTDSAARHPRRGVRFCGALQNYGGCLTANSTFRTDAIAPREALKG
jgi:hypothetical protein